MKPDHQEPSGLRPQRASATDASALDYELERMLEALRCSDMLRTALACNAKVNIVIMVAGGRFVKGPFVQEVP